MVDIFITDSLEKYNKSISKKKILYKGGCISECSFVSKSEIEDFNNTLMGIEDEANKLMLLQLDADTKQIISTNIKFRTNRFIEWLSPSEKIHSTFFTFYKHFVYNKYCFQFVFDRFFTHFSIPKQPLSLVLSEDLYLTKELPYNIVSASYYRSFKNVYFSLFLKQIYYFFHRLFFRLEPISKCQIAIFLYDIHNEFDLFKRFIELAKKQNKLSITIVVVDSGNPLDKRVNTKQYEGANVTIINLYDRKVNLVSNYKEFYSICRKINPLYHIFKRARFCESQDVQYGFVANVISKLSPDVCMYVNYQEFGRVVSNVSAYYHVPSICVEYSFFQDSYNIEKRIKFDVRACISEVTVFNWKKHNDPTLRHVITGFCKIDDWSEKLEMKKQSPVNQKLFANSNLTILFISTWDPNPKSPILTEKVKIAEQLLNICIHNNWNLIIKKHPSEFDNLIQDFFHDNSPVNFKIFEHHEMSLFDCIYYSDFVCTQNSTAFIEALYLNKPYSYITLYGENVWAKKSYFSREEVVKTFNGVKEYEQYIQQNSNEESYRKLLDEFMKLQAKYLYKTDGKASERLLELTQSFVK